jgi:hypothetical protein
MLRRRSTAFALTSLQGFANQYAYSSGERLWRSAASGASACLRNAETAGARRSSVCNAPCSAALLLWCDTNFAEIQHAYLKLHQALWIACDSAFTLSNRNLKKVLQRPQINDVVVGAGMRNQRRSTLSRVLDHLPQQLARSRSSRLASCSVAARCFTEGAR